MARSAKIYRINGSKPSGIQRRAAFVLVRVGLHRDHMLQSGTVTSFASYAENRVLGIKLSRHSGSCRMTPKTAAHGLVLYRIAQSQRDRGRRSCFMAEG